MSLFSGWMPDGIQRVRPRLNKYFQKYVEIQFGFSQFSVRTLSRSKWDPSCSSPGGGVQPAVCAPRAVVQEAACGPLPGLRQERKRDAGRLCGAGAAPDGGPDAGLRSVHISKSPGGALLLLNLTHECVQLNLTRTVAETFRKFNRVMQTCWWTDLIPPKRK